MGCRGMNVGIGTQRRDGVAMKGMHLRGLQRGIIVGDGEGAVVIPARMVEEIAAASLTMEIEEEFAIERVAEGAPTTGYFPIADENRAEFEEWLARRNA